MEEYYSEVPVSNTKSLCVGPITAREAEQLGDDAPFCDGFGLYLYVADITKPENDVQVLAKLTSEDAAQNLSKLLSRIA